MAICGVYLGNGIKIKAEIIKSKLKDIKVFTMNVFMET